MHHASHHPTTEHFLCTFHYSALHQSSAYTISFFGVDPTVKESGKFKGNQNRMSKRGTKLGRR
ncbi:MAG: hypothetical protein E4H13_13715 [Calditrichales bacterium]|nr:MAG: hypothetical protein E4H13_13715 [Calditrichales bacterium]